MSREAAVKRETAETKIALNLNLDGTGKSLLDSGIGFFDHMLNLMAVHGLMDLELRCDGDLEVDVQLHQAKRNGQILDLTAREFALLLLFMQSPERLITRTAILEQVWEMNFDPGTNILDVHMSHLRKKLDEGRKIKMLQTIRGIGYMLKAVEDNNN